MFVPVVADSVKRDDVANEVEVDGAVVRIAGTAKADLATAVVQALRVEAMIGPGAGARVMVATRSVDFRKEPDALAALVGKEYGGDPYSGVIYVFRAKRADRIKLVTGLCLMAKKLEQGGFAGQGFRTV